MDKSPGVTSHSTKIVNYHDANTENGLVSKVFYLLPTNLTSVHWFWLYLVNVRYNVQGDGSLVEENITFILWKLESFQAIKHSKVNLGSVLEGKN